MNPTLLACLHIAFGIAIGLLIAEVREQINCYRIRRKYRQLHAQRNASC